MEEQMSETFQYDVFLSYSSRDREKVHDLAQRLKEDGCASAWMRGRSSQAARSLAKSEKVIARQAYRAA